MVTIRTGARIDAVKVLHPMRHELYKIRSLIIWDDHEVRQIDAAGELIDALSNKAMGEGGAQ